MPSSMDINMTSYMLRNVNNRGRFVQIRGGYINKRGIGHGRTFGRRIYCQLCGKPGHFVDKCYYRFDRNFQRVPNQNLGKSLAIS